jgi:hypothetical protein
MEVQLRYFKNVYCKGKDISRLDNLNDTIKYLN